MRALLVLVIVAVITASQAVVAEPSSPHLYSITLEEKGLPPETNWSVTLGNRTYSAIGNIVLQEPNGSYSFKISQENGYTTSNYDYKLNLTVRGQNVTRVIYWVPYLYKVTFEESGLNPGSQWNVTAANEELSSNSSSITFYLPNGTYNYAVSAVNGTNPVPNAGIIVVNRSSVLVLVRYNVEVSVTFLITNLPYGSGWSVTINNHIYSSTDAAIDVNTSNSSYTYKIHVPFNYYAVPSSGKIHGNGVILISAGSYLPWEVLIAVILSIDIFIVLRIRKSRISLRKEQKK